MTQKSMKNSVKMIQKINKLKMWFFGKDEQYWQSFNQTHQEKERTQINKIRNKRGKVTTGTTENKCKKKLLQTTLCQEIGQPGWNWWISRNM